MSVIGPELPVSRMTTYQLRKGRQHNLNQDWVPPRRRAPREAEAHSCAITTPRKYRQTSAKPLAWIDRGGEPRTRIADNPDEHQPVRVLPAPEGARFASGWR
jgi:hypothetical protein